MPDSILNILHDYAYGQPSALIYTIIIFRSFNNNISSYEICNEFNDMLKNTKSQTNQSFHDSNFFLSDVGYVFFCVKSMFSCSETHRMISECKNHINSIYDNTLDIFIIRHMH